MVVGYTPSLGKSILEKWVNQERLGEFITHWVNQRGMTFPKTCYIGASPFL